MNRSKFRLMFVFHICCIIKFAARQEKFFSFLFKFKFLSELCFDTLKFCMLVVRNDLKHSVKRQDMIRDTEVVTFIEQDN